MIAEIISVGTELLLGNIVNTNAQYISKQLADLGIEVHFQTVVGDNPERIRSVLDIAYSRADLCILTGGLGPTKDDITREMIISYFNKKPVMDDVTVQMMQKNLDRAGNDAWRESLLKCAVVPDDSIWPEIVHRTRYLFCLHKAADTFQSGRGLGHLQIPPQSAARAKAGP